MKTNNELFGISAPHRLKGIGNVVYGTLTALGALWLLTQLTTAKSFDSQFAIKLTIVGTGLALGIVGLRSKEPYRSTGVFVIFVSVVLLVLAEFALLIREDVRNVLVRRNPGLKFLPLAVRAGIPFDARPWNEVVADLRSKGTEAYPFLAPSHFMEGNLGALKLPDGRRVLPLGGISNVPTVYGNESGHYVTYRSDEHGFHNPPNLYVPGKVQIAILGDSFGQGCCVPDGRDTAGIVRAKYPRTLTFGVSDNGPVREFAAIPEYLSALKPARVFWLFYAEDMNRIFPELDNEILRNYFTRGFRQDLAKIQNAIDGSLKAFANERLENATHRTSVLAEAFSNLRIGEALTSAYRLPRLKQAIGLIPMGYGGATPPSSSAAKVLFLSLLREAKREVEAWGGRLYFAYLPSWNRFGQRDFQDPYREFVIAAVRDTSVRLLDLETVMAHDPDPLRFFPFRQRGHYSEEGHRLLGESILAIMAAE